MKSLTILEQLDEEYRARTAHLRKWGDGELLPAYPRKDYTGVQFGDRVITGLAGVRESSPNILWHVKCLRCQGMSMGTIANVQKTRACLRCTHIERGERVRGK